MSTNLEYRAGERQRKGGRPAKLNKKKGYRNLEIKKKREKKKQRGHFFCWKNNMKIL